MNDTPNVAVIGSINIDVVVEVTRYPKPGETLIGENIHLIPGGKGANQAITVAKMGLPVTFIGCTGADTLADLATSGLRINGVDTSNLRVIKERMTGLANVVLEDDGENRIIVIPGANDFVTIQFVDEIWKNISNSDLIILQHEIPIHPVHHILQKARESGIKTLLNPAPYHPIPSETIKLIDILIVNKWDAEELFDMSIEDTQQALFLGRQAFSKFKMSKLIITLGKNGSVLIDDEKCIFQPAFIVNVTDTTGAGDVFVGSFAAALLNLKDDRRAMEFASAAAAISTTKIGAQDAIPDLIEVESFVNTSR